MKKSPTLPSIRRSQILPSLLQRQKDVKDRKLNVVQGDDLRRQGASGELSITPLGDGPQRKQDSRQVDEKAGTDSVPFGTGGSGLLRLAPIQQTPGLYENPMNHNRMFSTAPVNRSTKGADLLPYGNGNRLSSAFPMEPGKAPRLPSPSIQLEKKRPRTC